MVNRELDIVIAPTSFSFPTTEFRDQKSPRISDTCGRGLPDFSNLQGFGHMPPEAFEGLVDGLNSLLR